MTGPRSGWARRRTSRTFTLTGVCLRSLYRVAMFLRIELADRDVESRDVTML